MMKILNPVNWLLVVPVLLVGCGSTNNQSAAIKQNICSNLDGIVKPLIGNFDQDPEVTERSAEIRLDLEQLSNLNPNDESIREARRLFATWEDLQKQKITAAKEGNYVLGGSFAGESSERLRDLDKWCTDSQKGK